MVGAPSSAATRATAASTCAASETSQPTARALPPAAVIFSTVSLQAASSRSSTATARPSAASRTAVAAPMPRAAPVTMATRCSVVDMLVLLSLETSTAVRRTVPNERPLSSFGSRNARSPAPGVNAPRRAVTSRATGTSGRADRSPDRADGQARATTEPHRPSARSAHQQVQQPVGLRGRIGGQAGVDGPAARWCCAARSASGSGARGRRPPPGPACSPPWQMPSTARSAARTPATSTAGSRRSSRASSRCIRAATKRPGAAVDEHAGVDHLAALDPRHHRTSAYSKTSRRSCSPLHFPRPPRERRQPLRCPGGPRPWWRRRW